MSTNIKTVAADLTDSFFKDLQKQIAKQVNDDIAHKLAHIDINQTVRECVDYTIKKQLTELRFPPSSIPGDAIKIDTLRIVGENVYGGTHKLFMSTGIQDTASECQITILDSATVIENTLIAKDAEIKGDLTVDGVLNVTGEISPDSPFYKELVEHSAGLVRLSLNDDFFKQFSKTVFEQIKEQGIDLTKLTLNGSPIITGSELNRSIVESSLRTVGNLKTLVVDGDTTINQETLNIGIRRVGINTTEPQGAFEVWDDECEFLVKKQKKDTMMWGTTRPHDVVLSSNNKDNLVLNSDGSVTVAKIAVGNTTMSSSDARPAYAAKRGTIVWNTNADVGQPIGYVCVGGANWGSFGEIS
jgi:hypothetical protein